MNVIFSSISNFRSAFQAYYPTLIGFNKAVFIAAFVTAVHATSAIAATCSVFATQAEAKAYFIKYKAKELDRDKDGEACECLPGGSKDGAAICKKQKNRVSLN